MEKLRMVVILPDPPGAGARDLEIYLEDSRPSIGDEYEFTFPYADDLDSLPALTRKLSARVTQVITHVPGDRVIEGRTVVLELQGVRYEDYCSIAMSRRLSEYGWTLGKFHSGGM